MTREELLAYLFAPPVSAASETLARWVTESRRFQAYVFDNRSKIRKKLNSARTPESLQSLLLELDVARCLVEDARGRVEYEKFGQGKARTPDLTVTLPTGVLFNLEVTRVQPATGEAEGRTAKLIRVVCSKVGQCVPRMLNCLTIAMDGGSLAETEVHAAMKSLKRRVEHGDAELFSRHGFDDPAAFFKQFQWLSAMLLCFASEADEPGIILWANPQARHPLPPQIRRMLETAMSLTP